MRLSSVTSCMGSIFFLSSNTWCGVYSVAALIRVAALNRSFTVIILYCCCKVFFINNLGVECVESNSDIVGK